MDSIHPPLQVDVLINTFSLCTRTVCSTGSHCNYALNGLSHGFSLEYEGQRLFRAPDNLPSADTKPELIQERLHKEVQLG